MKIKRFSIIAAMFIVASLFLFVGCSLTGSQEPKTSSIQGLNIESISQAALPRQHWETNDSQDGMFYTYWEQSYTTGTASMTLKSHGYDATWNNYNNNDLVCGKGVNPCDGETISWMGGSSGAQYFGVYGWLQDPLVEYYIGRGTENGGAGTSQGTYSTSQGTYTLYQADKNGANIFGNGAFKQYNCKGQITSPINMAQHFAGWVSLGKSVNITFYCVVATEVWSSSSGSTHVSNLTCTAPSRSWQAVGSGMNGIVVSLAYDVKNNYIYAGGRFTSPANHIAKWNGSSWSALGSGVDDGINILVCDTNGNLYAGGWISSPYANIAKWNGSSWSAVGTGINGSVYSLAYDIKNNCIYAGGNFTSAGGVTVANIAKWNGSSWSALGSGLTGGDGGVDVASLACDTKGNLYASWSYLTYSGHGANTTYKYSKWNGTSWSDIGGTGYWDGTASPQGIVFDAPANPRNNIYFGGSFTSAAGVVRNHLAVYNGSSWSSLGSGVDQTAYGMAYGWGGLYIGGWFNNSGSTPMHGMAKWNTWTGNTLAAFGSGVGSSDIGVNALVRDKNNSLYAGGYFTTMDGHSASYIAVYK